MARGSAIIVSSQPDGKYIEGIIDGTPKPGTVMQIKAGVAAVEGRFTYEVFNQSGDGVPAPIIVLLEDWGQGKAATVAYETGKRGFMYAPAPGDRLNMLKGDVAGTGDDFAIGDRLMVDDGTGKLVAASSAESVPFICLETVTDPTADQLIHCQYTGH